MTDATLTTTLNAIRLHSPCEEGWRKLLAHLGKTKADDEPLPLLTIVQSNGVDDALWCLQAIPDAQTHPLILNFRSDCAARVLHLFERERPDDRRVRNAIIATRDFAAGRISREQLDAATASAVAARALAHKGHRFVERAWQTERLIGWLTGAVTEPLPLPEMKEAQ